MGREEKVVPLTRESFAALDHELLLDLYCGMLRSRLVEERMLLLLRKGGISKWFSGIGQEAVSVGCAKALADDEFLLPMHRNLGVFLSRGVALKRLFSQFQGKADGFTSGRDRSFHFGSLEHHIVGMISHLGPSLAVADGLALGSRLKGQRKVALTFCGDGATSEGDVHEAMNVASVWDLPVVFLIENNGYGLSTPVTEQYRCEKLADRASGYGMEGFTINGNDIVEVFSTVRALAQQVRLNSRPVVVEAITFRVRGHEEASGVKYVPPELIQSWKDRDPISNLEARLLKANIITQSDINQKTAEINAEIDEALELADCEPEIVADSSRESRSIFTASPPEVRPSGISKEMRFVDAVSDGLREALRKYETTIVMGQDIAEYGGVFKVTEGFIDEFGSERIRNTPLCESAILGMGVGLSIQGFKSVIEMQFADFVSSGFTQVINNIAKLYYRWQQPVDVVVRLPAGGGVAAGPFHSQTVESWFTHAAGLKVYYPAFPEDAKGLLIAAIADPNPVMFFEHKALYRRVSGPVPTGYYTGNPGQARLVREGEDLVIVTYGMGVHWALEFLEKNPACSAAVLDLRTLVPLDYDSIRSIVGKTGRALVLYEACSNSGFGAEVAAWIGEHCFELLDAPVMRCGSLDTPVPFAPVLEADYLASARLADTVEALLKF